MMDFIKRILGLDEYDWSLAKEEKLCDCKCHKLKRELGKCKCKYYG